MNTIKDLLQRDLDRKIEEVIQVDQLNEASIYEEVTEYIATDHIRNQYRELFQAMADAPSDPSEGVGVWISGFFGSGKSSFAKNIGHALSNPIVKGEQATELFSARLEDNRIHDLLELLNARHSTEVVMFDVSKGSNFRRTDDEKIGEIVYRALLSQLGYATDFDIAELEIQLEEQGQLDEFVALCPEVNDGQSWKIARKLSLKINVASAVLHRMNPSIFPHADSWAHSLREKETVLTIQTVVERAFTLMERRRPGQALVFIMDEVGQYVAHSGNKIEDLRALVEEFGKQSKNRLRTREAVAPIWIVVTSQEKLDEVASKLDLKRMEIARLRDRFHHTIDLAPADIREVASKRVLQKVPDADPLLRELYRKHEGQLTTTLQWERSQIPSHFGEEEFVQFYPYVPHFVELSIDIMSGIREQPGAMRQLGGSNRTIIGQIYQMLVNERTRFADKPIGTLVTLDCVYELIEGQISSERRGDIGAIAQKFDDGTPQGKLVVRVAKVIVLLEFVKGLPRTEENLAACLVEDVSTPKPLVGVRAAIEALEQSRFIRSTEDGWKLQTTQEKNWEEQRNTFSPSPRDYNELLRTALKEVWNEPDLRLYRHSTGRTFNVGVSLDGVPLGAPGQIPLALVTADDAKAFPSKSDATQAKSRLESHQYDVFWVFTLSAEVDRLVRQLYASGKMTSKYQSLANQNKLNSEEGASLHNESQRMQTYDSQLHDALRQSLENGASWFHGASREAATLGKTAPEIFRALFESIVPELYPRLELASRGVKGTEAEVLLKAANLNALPSVYYEGENGLSLVKKDGARFIIDTQAPVAQEILSYLKKEQSYGNKVTGKTLEAYFQGFGYGWERDVLRIVLAALLRAGAIEVTHNGKRYRNYQEPLSHPPLINAGAFRNAGFAPRESIGLKTLTQAVRHFEELTGDEVDVEEGAIAEVFSKWASVERDKLLPLEAQYSAQGLPADDLLKQFRGALDEALAAPSDDCVRMLAGEGKDLIAQRNHARQVQTMLEKGGAEAFSRAREALQVLWPALMGRPEANDLSETRDELKQIVENPQFLPLLPRLRELTEQIEARYNALYEELHARRHAEFADAIDAIRGHAEWVNLPLEIQAGILAALQSRVCSEEVAGGAARCQTCNATLGQMESDLAALGGFKAQALERLRELTAPAPPPGQSAPSLVRVQLTQYFDRSFSSTAEVDEAIEALKAELYALVEKGASFVVE